jgi:gliding motility-associated-like protein
VTVHPLPNAQFTALNVCDGDSVHFNNHSSIFTPDMIQSYAWNFGDGSAVNTNQSTTHPFAAVGPHAIQLVAVSNFGCRDSITKTTIVNPNPIVKISATPKATGCAPLCVNFIDSSSILTGNKKYWAWNVGDGSVNGTTQIFEHCYINTSVDTVAQFTVSLKVTSDSGCVTTGTKNNYISVYPIPKADFTVEPNSAFYTDPVISFTNLSAGASIWKWNFGDSDTSKVANPPPHTYADTGTYTITQFISTQYGCRDTMYKNITIEPDFVFYIPNAFSPDGDHINDTFFGKGVFITEYSMSIFDRWGNLIFFSDDTNLAWDGKANHGTEVAPRDVYVYSFKITDVKKRKHNYNGLVTLIR